MLKIKQKDTVMACKSKFSLTLLLTTDHVVGWRLRFFMMMIFATIIINNEINNEKPK